MRDARNLKFMIFFDHLEKRTTKCAPSRRTCKHAHPPELLSSLKTEIRLNPVEKSVTVAQLLIFENMSGLSDAAIITIPKFFLHQGRGVVARDGCVPMMFDECSKSILHMMHHAAASPLENWYSDDIVQSNLSTIFDCGSLLLLKAM